MYNDEFNNNDMYRFTNRDMPRDDYAPAPRQENVPAVPAQRSGFFTGAVYVFSCRGAGA